MFLRFGIALFANRFQQVLILRLFLRQSCLLRAKVRLLRFQPFLLLADSLQPRAKLPAALFKAGYFLLPLGSRLLLAGGCGCEFFEKLSVPFDAALQRLNLGA
jgi:hypothetical protein